MSVATDDVWILGIYMTKFGKHPDLDTVDLAADAAMKALTDAQVTMKDMGVMAAGNLMGAGAPIGQMVQKEVGQTGIPVYNVSSACATGATALRTAIMAVKAGECDMGLAVGVEKLAGAGLLGAGPDALAAAGGAIVNDSSACRHAAHRPRWSSSASSSAAVSWCRSRSARPASRSTTSPTRARPARPRCAR